MANVMRVWHVRYSTYYSTQSKRSFLVNAEKVLNLQCLWIIAMQFEAPMFVVADQTSLVSLSHIGTARRTSFAHPFVRITLKQTTLWANRTCYTISFE